MSEQKLELKRAQYLETINKKYEELRQSTKEFQAEQKKRRIELAKLIEEARLECDLSLAEISRNRNITRQAIHKIIKEAFGVRHPDKAQAALIGHKNKER